MKKILLTLSLTVLLSCNGQTASTSYERVNENNHWGFVNEKKEMIIPFGLYDFLNPIDELGMILATKNGKEGYIDIHQNILIPFDYEDLGVFTENGLAPTKKKRQNGNDK